MHAHEEVDYFETWQTDVGTRLLDGRSASCGLPLRRFGVELEPIAWECSVEYAHQYM